MDQQAFQTAKAAYQQGDMSTAASYLMACVQPGEVAGEVNHMLGNALMKLGAYDKASDAYGQALADTSYGKVGALSCNRGRALIASGRFDEAISALNNAVADPTYATPFKAQMALGTAYTKRGMLREAGVAFRNAAIDESNPDPSQALSKLGQCFMDLGRPVDAVEAYRTALDFSTPLESQSAVYASLGRAYVGSNRMSEAIDAFNHATSEGNYQLTPEDNVAFQAAQRAVSAINGGGPSSTDALLAAAGYAGSGAFDPLDPMGRSGEMMPSPEDTGFFSVSESDLVQQGKEDKRARRRQSHVGRNILIFLLLLIIAAAGFGGFAYYKGYGWPTQESVVTEMFQAKTDGSDIGSYLSGSVSSDTRTQIESILPSGATLEASSWGVDRQMASSTVTVKATLASGGSQDYTVSLVRDGLGWKVSKVAMDYASQASGTATVSGVASSSTSATTGTTVGSTTSATTTATTTLAASSTSTDSLASNATPAAESAAAATTAAAN